MTLRLPAPSRTLILSLLPLLLTAGCGSGGSTGSPTDSTPTSTPPVAATPTLTGAGSPPTAAPTPTGEPSPSGGALDASFGDDGVVRGDARLRPSLSDVAVQPDGRIVALARALDADLPETRPIALVGYDIHGSIDDTFGAGGVVTQALCPGYEALCAQLDARRLLALGDGRLLVLAVDASGAPASRLLLFAVDGGVDPSFGNRGVQVLPALLADVALAADGGVVGVGGGSDGFVLLRLSSDLVPDESFGVSGLRSVERDPLADSELFRQVALQPDGRIVASGSIATGDGVAAVVARFESGGALDRTFADSGWLVAPSRSDLFRGVSPDAGPLAVTADGRLLVEMPTAGNPASRTLLRLRSDGSIDASWGEPTDAADELLTDADGRVLAVGAHQVIDAGLVSQSYGVLRRFAADGVLDVSFGANGEVGLPLLDGSATFAAGAALQSDGKIVVACNRGGGGWLLARFAP